MVQGLEKLICLDYPSYRYITYITKQQIKERKTMITNLTKPVKELEIVVDNTLRKIKELKNEIKEKELDRYYSDSFEESIELSEEIDELKTKLEKAEKDLINITDI
ncbi:hypothetical protein FMG_P0007 (plasmid) [Finegoldia magna ATCC 29328]|uniref:Uncharacterized protein n=2 Tax=Finegoldia magna TaxID=1260 RepID=B0S465_FINM2|nr:hypothetical protein FMG_P0007 [Finegoldia magna ATCC 29328]